MSVLQLTFLGNPVLRRVADAVADPTAEDIARLAGDMRETMLAEKGVGLAAPQVDISRRLIVFRTPRDEEAEDDKTSWDFQTLINPEITPLGDETELGWEGCLSLPNLRGIVPRYTRIGYRGFDETGKLIEREAEGFHARVVQHEVDHLNGVMYLDRMPNMATLVVESELEKFMESLAEKQDNDGA